MSLTLLDFTVLVGCHCELCNSMLAVNAEIGRRFILYPNFMRGLSYHDDFCAWRCLVRNGLDGSSRG